jgi:hydroxyethylthiazole kinase-like sugar kinase family protein
MRANAEVVELLSHWQPTVIKGNAAEIGAMAESTEVRPFPLIKG